MENLNLNIEGKTLEMCLKSINNFGGTTYQNICNGTINYVAWGGVDWVLVIILSLLGIAIAGFILGMMFKIILEIYELLSSELELIRKEIKETEKMI